MTIRSTLNALFIVFMVSVPAFSFSMPQLFWPQKDMDSSSQNNPAFAKKILIASRDTDYKRALLEKIKEGLKGDSVYIKCIGLTKLKKEDASAYQAIVLINTCMGWSWDLNIDAFLKGKTDAANVIVLTTSASGKWGPKKNTARVDAIAAASEKINIDTLAADIIKKIRTLLEKK
jgi:hypothetical protein